MSFEDYRLASKSLDIASVTRERDELRAEVARLKADKARLLSIIKQQRNARKNAAMKGAQ